jgi:glycosyltransferase involved in cell wall biosynthesis
MRVLYLSQYFPPEVGATQSRAYEMAQGLRRAGHQVTMIAEVPNHPSGIIPPEYRGKLYERSQLDGIEVIRVWVKTTPVKTFGSRLAFYLSYMVMATLAGLFLARGRYEVIYATSPPLFVGGAALVISYLRQIPLVFEVRDLWPESAVALGELRNRRAIAGASWLEERCYRRAKAIVVVTHGILRRLQERGYPAGQLRLIPNGANPAMFQFQAEAGQTLRQRLGLADKFVVIYGGVHGLAQGLEFVIEAARQLAGRPDIHFLFVGEGPVKAQMVALAESAGLSNITFHPEVPRQAMPAFLSAAQIALVPLRRLDLFQAALPSKIFDAWACHCPTLVMIEGEAQQVVNEAGAGLFVEPENVPALVEAIITLRDDPALRRRMGRQGQTAVIAQYSRQALAQQLVQLLEQVASVGYP